LADCVSAGCVRFKRNDIGTDLEQSMMMTNFCVTLLEVPRMSTGYAKGKFIPTKNIEAYGNGGIHPFIP
jgi:hypothetical protein